MLAVMVAFAVSAFVTLRLAYSMGALNLHEQYFQWFPERTWDIIARKLHRASYPSVSGYAWTAVGAAGMLALTVAHRTLAWWPLHPLGYLAQGGWIMSQIWFSIFLAWAIKVGILHLGGGRVYKKATDFFMGLILGVLVVGGVWLVIDAVTGMRGNVIRVY